MSTRAKTGRPVLAVLATVAGLATACGGGSTAPEVQDAAPPTTVAPAPPSTSITAVEPAGTYGEAVTQVIPLGLDDVDPQAPPGPEYLSYGSGAVWVGQHRSHAVTRVDGETGEVEATVAIDPAPGSTSTTEVTASGPASGTGSVLATDDGVWALDLAGFAWRIDPGSNEVADRIDVPGLRAESGLAFDDGRLWTLTSSGFSRFDLATNELSDHLLEQPSFGNGPQVVAAPGAVWLGAAGGAVRVDPATGEVEGVTDGFGMPLGAAQDLVWGVQGTGVVGIDPQTTQATRSIGKPAGVGSLLADSATVAGDSLWVVARPAGDQLGPDRWFQLVHFDLASGAVDHVDLMNAEFDFTVGLTVGDDAVWTTDFARGNLLRIPIA